MADILFSTFYVSNSDYTTQSMPQFVVNTLIGTCVSKSKVSPYLRAGVATQLGNTTIYQCRENVLCCMNFPRAVLTENFSCI